MSGAVRLGAAMENTSMRVKVPDSQADRHVILMEADPLHPTDNHEVFLVGYPGEKNEFEVGDTPGVRAKIASGELVEVGGRHQIEADEPDEKKPAAGRR
jgi:hypothetical protein